MSKNPILLILIKATLVTKMVCHKIKIRSMINALWNQVVKFHKETGSEEKKFISKFLLYPFFIYKNFWTPLWVKRKFLRFFSSNDRLELMVSTQKLVLKNVHQVLRFLQKCNKTQAYKQNIKKFLIFLPISLDPMHIFPNQFLC